MTLVSLVPEFALALRESILMLVISLSCSALLGGATGILLYLWGQDRLLKKAALRVSVGGAVNVIRSFPFVILMIATGPFARLIAGTSIGPIAAAVPLSIAGTAYFARLVELSLLEVPRGTVEASLAMGASLPKIVFSVLLIEARASLILGFTALSISCLSYSAAAGVIGGGGIGDLAIRYGYYRFQTHVMVVTVIGMVLFVQTIQTLGNYFSRRSDKR
jgi:D-methionine transport system permease protein